MEEKNLQEEIVGKAAELASANAEVKIEETKSELTETINKSAEEMKSALDELKEQNEMLQKNLDDAKTEFKSINVVKNTGSGSELESALQEKAEELKNINKTGRPVGIELTKAASTFTGAASAAMHQPYAYTQVDQIYHDPNFKNRVRNNIPTMTTGSTGSITFNRETAETDNAGSKAKGGLHTATQKTLQKQTEEIQTLYNLFTIPEEWLGDIPMVENYLRKRLMGDLMDVEDDQLLNGDGTSPNYNGIITQGDSIRSDSQANADSDLGDWANSIENANRFDAITCFASLLAQDDFVGDTVFLNPFDYYQMTLIKTGDGSSSASNYALQQTQSPNGLYETIWNGIKLVKTNAIAANEFVMVDSSAIDYFMREGVSLEFDRYSDDFARNNISVRLSLRGALVNYLSGGVRSGIFNNVSTTAFGVVDAISA